MACWAWAAHVHAELKVLVPEVRWAEQTPPARAVSLCFQAPREEFQVQACRDRLGHRWGHTGCLRPTHSRTQLLIPLKPEFAGLPKPLEAWPGLQEVGDSCESRLSQTGPKSHKDSRATCGLTAAAARCRELLAQRRCLVAAARPYLTGAQILKTEAGVWTPKMLRVRKWCWLSLTASWDSSPCSGQVGINWPQVRASRKHIRLAGCIPLLNRVANSPEARSPVLLPSQSVLGVQ